MRAAESVGLALHVGLRHAAASLNESKKTESRQELQMRNLVIIGAAVALSGCGLAGQSTAGKAETIQNTAAFEGPVPRALCGPGSNPEPGMQGRTADAEMLAALAEKGERFQGYSCNLEEVAHEGNGALWQMAWYEDCAYYGLGVGFATGNTAGFVPGSGQGPYAGVPGGGVAVVKMATDPETGARSATRTLTLETPAMIDPWETLKVNERRGLLAGSSVSLAGSAFDVYDVKGSIAGNDCSTPVLAASSVNGLGHEGEWAPDGMTYYSSGFVAPATQAIDVTEPNAPHIVASLNRAIHGLSLSDNGERLYAAKHGNPNGLEIWNTSAIQSRSNTATSTVVPVDIVGAVYWEDGAVAQMTIPVTIKGKPYVIFIDEGGRLPEGGEFQLPGMARIIDISDEKNPVIVSKLKDEIDMEDAGPIREADGGGSGFTYQGHYCGVPQRVEPGVLACSYFWQGIRVWDIRDPAHPKEIAYFVPSMENATAGPFGDVTRAHTSSAIRFIPELGEMWFTNQNTGFHAVKFTNGVWPFPKEPEIASASDSGDDGRTNCAPLDRSCN
jgi:hypothetical protein